jgi:LPS-assembly protein
VTAANSSFYCFTNGIALARNRLLAAVVAIAVLAVPALPALAQALFPVTEASDAYPDGQLVVEADSLVYDFDRETVTAIGNVQIYRGTAFLDAERVVYDQKAGRLTASGGVRLLEPDGNVLTADTLDITDDFRDGFVESLNVVTTERARFTAQSAERRGDLLIFRKGVYTACAQCQEDPGRPPLWQIKAARIIHDRAARTVYYRDARFEFLGVPIAYTPVFFHPDPTVKRKTGFLAPSVLQSGSIGFGVTTPFFWNLAPNYDVTFSPTLLTKQGLLMQTEWRHRVLNGAYSVRLAGIFQGNKDEFREDGEELSGYRDFRGSVRTTAEVAINSRWNVGWDLHGSTDRTFNRDYRIEGATARDLTSTAYLTGISERNFFDLRGYYFRVQRENTVEDEGLLDGPDEDLLLDDYVHDDQDEQAVVLPVVDHTYIVESVFGGELRFDSNITNLAREKSDIQHPDLPYDPYYAGVAGNFARATSRATWQRRFIAPAGQLITPIAYAQFDGNLVSSEDDDAGLTTDDAVARAMPAVGVDYEWPILALLGSTVHTFGPRAQLIVRPNEQHAGELPNEDAQSLVFDDTNLFEFDKFSGYDRQEGGTRANLGFTYQGLFPNGASIDALVGQSYQIAGDNPFEQQDHALTGVGSGLEGDASDYVTRVTLNSGTGLALNARARLDDNDLSLHRGEFNALGTFDGSVASLGYAFINQVPELGIDEARQEINGATALKVSDNWSVLGSFAYDLAEQATASQSVGLAYGDECLEVSAVFSETADEYSDLPTDRQVFVRFNLRTLTNDRPASLIGPGRD